MRIEDFFRNIASVTIKLTHGCNLKCTYCNTETVTPQTPMMSAELHKRIARLVIENSTHPFVSLEYHGGEPMLLSDEWFEETSSYAKELAKLHGKQLELPMVTNGTILTRERMLKLRDMGIRFCISSDGPPDINDLLRGGGHAVERSIRMLKEHEIPVGIMTVVSRANYNRMTEIMDWFAELDIKSFSANFVQPQGRGIDSDLLSGKQMFEAMRQVLDHMYNTGVSVEEGDMARYVERFIEGRPSCPESTCWEYECQAGKSYVAIDLFGKIHACGSDVSSHVLGHVSRDIDDDVYREKMSRLHAKSDWVIRCFDCNAKQICNHSCATSDFNSEQAKENECAHTKMLWTHMCENPEKPKRIYDVLSRQWGPRNGGFVPVSELEYTAGRVM